MKNRLWKCSQKLLSGVLAVWIRTPHRVKAKTHISTYVQLTSLPKINHLCQSALI